MKDWKINKLPATRAGKAHSFGLFTCLLIYIYSAFRIWQGLPDLISILTLGKAFIVYYFLSWGEQWDTSYPIIIALIILTFIFDFLLISGIWYLGLFIFEKLKAK